MHNSQNLKYRKPFGAVKTDSKVTLSIEADLCEEVILNLTLFNGEKKSFKMTLLGENQERGTYHSEIFLEEPGLVNYYFTLKNKGKTFYYGNNEEVLGGVGKLYTENPKPYQITVYKDFKVPCWYKEGIIYQIFVDRFFNGNEKGIVNNPKKKSFIYGDWYDEPLYVRTKEGRIAKWDFFGGNLEGVMKKLPYIKSLGVNVIYLNPIFEAASNHKYDIADYKTIDPMFGDEEKFKELCHKAKQLDIRIILDGVFSHTGSDSIYFNKYGNYESLGAYESPESPYYKWYRFSEYPDKYECWWGIDNHPNVEELEESYVDFIIKDEDSVISKWMKAGAWGWRLDVADELPDEFIALIKSRMKEVKEDSVLIGEVWEDASNKTSYGHRRKYVFGEELDSITNYPFRNMVIEFLLGNISADKFIKRFMSLKENYPEESFYGAMNLLGNHDTERILTRLGEGEKAIRLLKLATAIQMCLPGVPLIYYGDEVGLTGGKDPENRKTYPWERENQEILQWYKKISSYRRDLEVLKKGDITFIELNENVLCFLRKYEKELLLVLVNIEEREYQLNIKLQKGEYEELISGEKFNVSEELWSMRLAPLQVKILNLL